MSDGPAPGEHDESELLDAVRRILAAMRQAHADQPGERLVGFRAYHDFERREESTETERMAGLYLLMLLTNEWEDPAKLAEAARILTSDDPRRTTVERVAHRIAAGTITWTQLLRVTRKPLVRSPPPAITPPPADATPLAQTRKALQTTLADCASVQSCVERFAELAQRPVAPPPSRVVDHDMCLFEWSRSGRSLAIDLTRQFTLVDGDGDYVGMKHLRATILVDADIDPAAAGDNTIWSGDDLDGWAATIRSHPLLAAYGDAPPSQVRVELEDV